VKTFFLEKNKKTGGGKLQTKLAASLFLVISWMRLFLRGVGFVKSKICIREK
jgi:hypothetical protein